MRTVDDFCRRNQIVDPDLVPDLASRDSDDPRGNGAVRAVLSSMGMSSFSADMPLLADPHNGVLGEDD